MVLLSRLDTIDPYHCILTIFFFFVHPDLAQKLRDAGIEDDLDDESDSVSTLETTEDGLMTDFEALADVEVEDATQDEVFAIQDEN